MDSYLIIKNLKVGFQSYSGLHNVVDIDELTIERGQSYALVGESGSGKTVTAFALQQLLTVPPARISAEELSLDGIHILEKSQREMTEIRGRKIAMIFQDPMSTLNPVFTVGEQIIQAVRCNHKLSKREAHQRAVELVETVKLPDAERILKKYPHELSGGQRQRIIIAIALGCGAELLIADEPTRNLDVTIQAGILKLLATLQREQKLTVLFITNNLSLVPLLCERVGLLYHGQIMESGTTAEVIDGHCHPYTEALIQPLPVTQSEKEAVKTATAEEAPVEQGCPFQNKCRFCAQICRQEAPGMVSLSSTHKVRCHRYQEGVREQWASQS